MRQIGALRSVKTDDNRRKRGEEGEEEDRTSNAVDGADRQR
jgi:hypothetical protein